MTKPYRTILLVVLALAVVLAGAYVLFTKKVLSPAPLEEGMLRYESAEHGFSFSYPEGYALTEREAGTGHTQIMLVAKTDAAPPVNGEGPTSVMVDVYEDALTSSVMDWVMVTSESNYQIRKGDAAGADVAGKDGYTYEWSGLYEGRTTAFANGADIFTVTVTGTWMTPEDGTVGVFDQVIRTFRFTDGSVLGEQKG